MTLEATQTVREVVQQHPAAVPVLEELGIDYCCGGGKTLEDACSAKNVPLNELLSQLENALATRPTSEDRRWMTSSLTELAEYIVEQHHAYAKKELPRLLALASKVHLRHGHAHPELNRVRELVEALSNEVGSHLLKEEQILFPRLKTIEDAADAGIKPPPAFFGSLFNPIRHMLGDHDDAGELLRSLRSQTHDYTLPDDACMSYKALYQGLSDLERDLHQHIHLENNILFPRALEFEKTH